jgi:hypothetical protein
VEDELDRRDADGPEDEGLPDHEPPLPQKEATGDAQEGMLISRRDHPRAAASFGTTAAEQREGESLDDRVAEEQPDEEPAERPQAGRLVEEDRGLIDTEKDEVGLEATEDTEGLTAEEAAMRVEPEAPGGTEEGSDRYVEEP